MINIQKLLAMCDEENTKANSETWKHIRGYIAKIEREAEAGAKLAAWLTKAEKDADKTEGKCTKDCICCAALSTYRSSIEGVEIGNLIADTIVHDEANEV